MVFKTCVRPVSHVDVFRENGTVSPLSLWERARVRVLALALDGSFTT
jgi:hypothetical protein